MGKIFYFARPFANHEFEFISFFLLFKYNSIEFPASHHIRQNHPVDFFGFFFVNFFSARFPNVRTTKSQSAQFCDYYFVFRFVDIYIFSVLNTLQGIHVSHDREFVRDADEMDLSDEDSDHYGRYTKRTRLSLRVSSVPKEF